LNHFMEQICESISQDVFKDFKNRFLAGYQSTEEKVRLAQKQKWLNNRENTPSP